MIRRRTRRSRRREGSRLRRAVWTLLSAMMLLVALPAGIASARTESSGRQGSPRVAMILLDDSTALASTEIEAERQAALRYARALPPDVEVGLVKFSSRWQVMLTPTADRGALAAALNAIHRPTSDATGIYSALAGRGVGGAGGGRQGGQPAAGAVRGRRHLEPSGHAGLPRRRDRVAQGRG